MQPIMITDLKKYIPDNKKNIGFILIVLMIFFLPRIISLGNDIVNVDNPLWMMRSHKFIQNFLAGNYSETYQKYHPGVTVMILSGSSTELFKFLFEKIFHYNPTLIPQQFTKINFMAKFPLILIITLLATYVTVLIKNITKSSSYAYIFAIILSFEPFFLGITKFLHLTGLATMFSFGSFLSIYYYYYTKSDKLRYIIVAGILIGLGALTKVNTIIVGIPIGILFLYNEIWLRYKTQSLRKNVKSILLHSLILSIIPIIIFIIFFPAMWVTPMLVITKIVNAGIKQTAFSDKTDETITNIKLLFYPEISFLRMSPILSLSTMLGILLLIKNSLTNKQSHPKILSNLLKWNLLYIVVFIIMLTIPSKNKDRYAIILFPAFAVIGAYSLYTLYKFNNYAKYITIVLLSSFYLVTAYRYHPTYSLYYNDIVGGPAKLQNYMNIFNRGELYPQVAFYLNKKDEETNPKNVLLTERFKFASFKDFFYGKTYINTKFMPDGYNADYIILRPKEDFSFDKIPTDKCNLIKTFGVKAPNAFNQLYLYECKDLDNTYRNFRN